MSTSSDDGCVPLRRRLPRSLLTVIALTLVTIAGAATASLLASGASARVAFDRRGWLRVIRADGSGRRLIARNSPGYVAVSPNGTQVAYYSWTGTSAKDSLWVTDLESGRSR